MIREFQLKAGEWQAIEAPVACDYYYVMGAMEGTALERASDPEGASYKINSEYGYAMMAPFNSPNGNRYGKGKICTYLRSAAGATVVVEFIA